LFRKPNGERQLGRPRHRDGKVILKWILGKQDGKVSTAGLCEHSNEPSGSIKGGEFLD
jgi:hypothetical protein